MTKTTFDNTVSSLNNKIERNQTKHAFVETELKNVKIFDFGYFIGKTYFEEDGTQNYWVIQPIVSYFKFITNANNISSWKSKGLSPETIKPPTTSDNSVTPTINYYYAFKLRVKFTGSYLKQSVAWYTHRKIVNIYIVYELGASISNINVPH